jgi:orotidine-5'-phosphate decarboxylase
MINKLYEAIEKKGTVCVGLDTAVEYIPDSITEKYENVEDQLFNFNKKIIDATYDVTATYKVQIAYYEAEGLNGLRAYKRTLEYIREKNILVIADVKRGDIAKTAEMYAKAHFSGELEADFMTINPYMGIDTLEPYYDYLKKGKGIFVLLKTSNPGSGAIQNIKSENGEYVYQILADLLEKEGKKFMGSSSYSSIGAVVGCTHVEEGKAVRKQMPGTFFLVPGYGAQGGTAADVSEYLVNGNGGIVNSSRGILLAYKRDNPDNLKFDEASRNAVVKMRDAILKESKRG